MDPEARRAEAMDRYWDEIVAGRAAAPAGVDAASADVLRRLLLLAHDPGLADAGYAARGHRRFANGTTEDDMDAATVTTTWSGERALPGWNPPWSRERPARRGMALRGGWPAAQLATAALLLLTLAAGLVAFDPGRPARRPGGPAGVRMAAPAAATPAPAAAQIVEFLWDTQGDPSMPLREPSAVAIDPAGSLWIPDADYGRILIFAPDGRFLEAWGAPGSGDGEFDFSDAAMSGLGFGDVAFDAAGNIYVADTGNHRVQKFGPDRAFIAAWGGEGTGAGQFRRLTAIAVDRAGRVYAADNAWGKIEVFDTDGNWIETWTGFGTPLAIAIEDDGSVLVADMGAGVQRFSPAGEPLATLTRYGSGEGEFLGPSDLAVDAVGRIYVSDLNRDLVQILAPDGTFIGAWGGRGVGPGEFYSPQGVALDGDGIVYVNDGPGRRLQAFRLLPPLAPAASPAP